MNSLGKQSLKMSDGKRLELSHLPLRVNLTRPKSLASIFLHKIISHSKSVFIFHFKSTIANMYESLTLNRHIMMVELAHFEIYCVK